MILSLLAKEASFDFFMDLFFLNFYVDSGDLLLWSSIQHSLCSCSPKVGCMRCTRLLDVFHGWKGCGAIGSGVHGDDVFVQR